MALFFLVPEFQSVTISLYDNRFVSIHHHREQLLRQVVQQVSLDGTLHRTGTEFRIITGRCQEVDGHVAQVQVHSIVFQHPLDALDLQTDNLFNFGLVERLAHKVRGGKAARNEALSQRALKALDSSIEEAKK